MLDLRRLRYFVTVADELHFGRAAVRLRIAQPPLTRHIAALETELGIRLFERSTRAVQLTPAGVLFLEQARSVIHAVDEAEATARKMAQGTVGRVVIGYASSIPMSDAFSDIVRKVSRSMPEVELAFREVSTASQRQQIADGTMDIGFGWSAVKTSEPGIASLVVSREPLVAAVPAQSKYAGNATIAFSELVNENFVTFPSGYGSALNAALDDLCAHEGVTPRIGPTASQITTLVSPGGSGTRRRHRARLHVDVATLGRRVPAAGEAACSRIGRHVVRTLLVTLRRAIHRVRQVDRTRPDSRALPHIPR